MISHIYNKPLQSNLQQPANPPLQTFQISQGLRPAVLQKRKQRCQRSCYLQGPRWADQSTCFLSVWLLFSAVGLTSDKGMLLAPSTDGADAT
jgi:hypothetical protein